MGDAYGVMEGHYYTFNYLWIILMIVLD